MIQNSKFKIQNLKIMYIFNILAIILLVNIKVFSGEAQVVPCQLTNADQDTLRLFPDRTNYRIEFIRTDEMGDKRKIGGEALYRELEKRLGDKWDPIWETEDIPYVFYEILKGPERIGWVFGANQGWPGADNSQLMFAFDDNRIREFYYQKLPSFDKEKLQTSEFYSQFIGLTLEHFYVHEQLKNLKISDKDILALDMVSRIINPSQKEEEGFQKTLRGMKKVLIYMDDFKFGNKIKKDEVFEKVKYIAENKNKISFLGKDTLSEVKKSFPDASGFVVDFVYLKNNTKTIEERLGENSGDLIYPVYVAYKHDVYTTPFVKGRILGYILPLTIDPQNTAIITIGAQDKEKGKILNVKIGKTEVAQFKGLSLVHFYTKDVLTKLNKKDEKIDKIAPIKVVSGNNDISASSRVIAKKALIIVDEFYLNNFFKKDEIMKKIEEYLKKK